MSFEFVEFVPAELKHASEWLSGEDLCISCHKGGNNRDVGKLEQGEFHFHFSFWKKLSEGAYYFIRRRITLFLALYIKTYPIFANTSMFSSCDYDICDRDDYHSSVAHIFPYIKLEQTEQSYKNTWLYFYNYNFVFWPQPAQPGAQCYFDHLD